MTTSTRETLDAAGRALRLGDYVGAIPVSSFHPVFGPVTALDEGVVTLQAAEPLTLPAPRTFLIGRPLLGVLNELGMQLAEWGPALFYVTPAEKLFYALPEENETRTITRADHGAPHDERERTVCHALIGHALSVLDNDDHNPHTLDDGPAIVYAASDRATLTRVDQETVDDPRERALCRALLIHAQHLAAQPVPVVIPALPYPGDRL